MFKGGGKIRTSTVTQSTNQNQSRIKSMKTGIIEQISAAENITELDALVAKMRGYTGISKATLRRGLRKANARAGAISNPR